MHIVDLLIILIVVSSLFRGYQVGFVRQVLSTAGFVAGLFLGSWASNFLFSHIKLAASKSLVSLLIILIVSFGLMTIGEVLGARLQTRYKKHTFAHNIDSIFGSAASVATLVIGLWLAAALLLLAPAGFLQQAAHNSTIITAINHNLPPANRFLSALNKFIDPNDFPQVFTGSEPSPDATNQLPSDSAFSAILAKSRASVVKIEGYGCGGIVDGSGFIAAPDRVVTNAHVVAGVHHPKIVDGQGTHSARVILFDKSNDLAVLNTNDLRATPLPISTASQDRGTGILVAGYPGGGGFNAQTGVILDRFIALGRDIYNQGTTRREVYSLQAHIVQGNSGGPVINQAGEVIGIVFATSTSYNNVGYALTTAQVSAELSQLTNDSRTVSTGQCSE